jgi:hypothetical protein
MRFGDDLNRGTIGAYFKKVLSDSTHMVHLIQIKPFGQRTLFSSLYKDPMFYFVLLFAAVSLRLKLENCSFLRVEPPILSNTLW